MIRKLPVWVWFGGIVLTFSAGLVNAIALLSFVNEAATHVTGSVTLAASSMAQGNWEKTLHLSAVILSFFLGSVVSGLITRGSRLKLGRRYGFALALESVFLMASMLLFQRSSLWGQLLASLACGLQNGMLTTFSGAIIRTTHMTGIVTDLGNKIGHWLTGSKMDKRRFTLYLLLLVGFIGGGITGSASFAYLGYRTMMIPVVITGVASILYTAYAILVHNRQDNAHFNN